MICKLSINLSCVRKAKARSELPPSISIHGQTPGLPEARTIQGSPMTSFDAKMNFKSIIILFFRSLLSCSAQVVRGRPRGRFQLASGMLPQRTPTRCPQGVVCWDP